MQLLPDFLHLRRETTGHHADVMIASVDQQADLVPGPLVGIGGFQPIRHIKPYFAPGSSQMRCSITRSPKA